MPVNTPRSVSAEPPSQTALARLTRLFLRLYPPAWRERYEAEVVALLARHPVTAWTTLDILLGALDAHLHRNLLPERLTSMPHRMRTAEIATFCAFVLFASAWLPLRLVRDPLPIWNAATRAHPEVLTALNAVDLCGIVATLGVVVGGLPILATAIMQAVRARRWRLLALFAVPLISGAALATYALVALPSSGQRTSSASNAPLTPLAVVLQLVFVLLALAAIAGSAAALAAAISRSEPSERILRFGLFLSLIVALALAGGLISAGILTGLIFAEAPTVTAWPPLHAAILLMMLVAVLIAAFAASRGLRASRQP